MPIYLMPIGCLLFSLSALRALLWFSGLVAQLYHQRRKGASFHNTYEVARYVVEVRQPATQHGTPRPPAAVPRLEPSRSPPRFGVPNGLERSDCLQPTGQLRLTHPPRLAPAPILSCFPGLGSPGSLLVFPLFSAKLARLSPALPVPRDSDESRQLASK